MKIMQLFYLALSSCAAASPVVQTEDGGSVLSENTDAGVSDGVAPVDRSTVPFPIGGPADAGRPLSHRGRQALTRDGALATARYEDGFWTLRMGRIDVVTHPMWQRKTNRAGNMGSDACGGLVRSFNGTEVSYSLEWHLSVSDARADETELRDLFAIPTEESLIVLPFEWEKEPGLESFAVNFGGTFWALAGRTIYQTFSYSPAKQIGLVSFGRATDTKWPLAQYAQHYPVIDMGSARTWDGSQHLFREGLTAQIEAVREHTLLQGSNLCPVVLWTAAGFDAVIATTACITPKGELTHPRSAFVSTDKIGLPSVSEINELKGGDP